MLLIERVERRYLADRTGLVTAAFMSGSEVEPPTFDGELEAFDEALAAAPEPESDRERSNREFLEAIGGAA